MPVFSFWVGGWWGGLGSGFRFEALEFRAAGGGGRVGIGVEIFRFEVWGEESNECSRWFFSEAGPTKPSNPLN